MFTFRPNRAAAMMAAKTTAAPVMSAFMSSMPAEGFKERPPESNVTPLPTRAVGGPSPPR